MNLKLVTLFAFIFLLPPFLSAHAQLDLSGVADVRGSGTVFQVFPKVPGPNQKVKIVLENSDLNLDSALITWTVNGQRVKSGTGEKSLTIQTGDLGTQSTVRVTTMLGSTALSDTIILRPSEVDILWQGRGYVPPFYKGRNLLAKEGYITIMAIPHVYNSNGHQVDPSKLIYRWSMDGTILGGSSGTGKNYLIYADSVLALTRNITIDIFENNTLSASNSVLLQAINPVVTVYENNPLYGYLFNKEVGSEYILNKEEVTFAAFPYFFNPLERNSPFLNYEWSTNTAKSSKNTSQVTFRSEERKEGYSTLRVRAKSTDFVLQSISKDFLVQFKNEGSL